MRIGHDTDTIAVIAGLEHHQVWLVDRDGADANPNLRFVLDDTADAIHTLRTEGERVFVHCVAGASRTPAVAAVHLARHGGIPAAEALEFVAAAIPCHNRHNTSFIDALGGT
ncbi:MAG: dual specificity protein phosphatase [Nitriliruptoraceae bacterium]